MCTSPVKAVIDAAALLVTPAEEDFWRALSSPWRRRILDLLRHDPRTTGDLADRLFRALTDPDDLVRWSAHLRRAPGEALGVRAARRRRTVRGLGRRPQPFLRPGHRVGPAVARRVGSLARRPRHRSMKIRTRSDVRRRSRRESTPDGLSLCRTGAQIAREDGPLAAGLRQRSVDVCMNRVHAHVRVPLEGDERQEDILAHLVPLSELILRDTPDSRRKRCSVRDRSSDVATPIAGSTRAVRHGHRTAR